MLKNFILAFEIELHIILISNNPHYLCRISGSAMSGQVQYGLLACNFMHFRDSPLLWVNISPLYSWLKSKPSKKPH